MGCALVHNEIELKVDLFKPGNGAVGYRLQVVAIERFVDRGTDLCGQRAAIPNYWRGGPGKSTETFETAQSRFDADVCR